MEKKLDYTLDYTQPWNVTRCICRVRVYEEQDAVPVVVITQLPENHGTSVTNAIEEIATHIWNLLDHPRELLWVEHYYRGLDGEVSTTIVTFELYDRPFKAPRWTRIHPKQIETLIGSQLD